MSFTADINGHQVNMDTTADDGGDDTGVSPKRLMLASLAGCTGMDVVSLLRKMKVQFSDFSINITAHVTAEHPKFYDQVSLNYTIRLAVKDQPKMEKAISLSQEKYCGVSAMFRAFSKMETTIRYLN